MKPNAAGNCRTSCHVQSRKSRKTGAWGWDGDGGVTHRGWGGGGGDMTRALGWPSPLRGGCRDGGAPVGGGRGVRRPPTPAAPGSGNRGGCERGGPPGAAPARPAGSSGRGRTALGTHEAVTGCPHHVPPPPSLLAPPCPPSPPRYLAGGRSSVSPPAAMPPRRLFSSRHWGTHTHTKEGWGGVRTPQNTTPTRPGGGCSAPRDAHGGGWTTHPLQHHHPVRPWHGGLIPHSGGGFRVGFPPEKAPPPSSPPPAHRTWSNHRVPSRAESHFSSAAAPGAQDGGESAEEKEPRHRWGGPHFHLLSPPPTPPPQPRPRSPGRQSARSLRWASWMSARVGSSAVSATTQGPRPPTSRASRHLWGGNRRTPERGWVGAAPPDPLSPLHLETPPPARLTSHPRCPARRLRGSRRLAGGLRRPAGASTGAAGQSGVTPTLPHVTPISPSPYIPPPTHTHIALPGHSRALGAPRSGRRCV